jgi:hypothetical protein
VIVIDGMSRSSGSQLSVCVYKTGRDCMEQARIMQQSPRFFCPVVAVGAEGYAMPLLSQMRNSTDVAAALRSLGNYWYTKSDRSICSRSQYHEHVSQREADPLLKRCELTWWEATKHNLGITVQSIHGDATLENAMLLNELPVWFDPVLRTAPLEAELDCGKLLQSMYGYHPLPAGSVPEIKDFLMKAEVNMSLVHYYFATHLVRMWPFQPQYHSWILSVAKEVLGAT